MELQHLPVIDWDLGLKLAGNNRETAEEILALFLKNIPDELTAINHSWEEKNYLEMCRQLHKLHGALCYCGLPRLKIVVARLESDLKKDATNDLPTLVKSLNQEVDELLKSA